MFGILLVILTLGALDVDITYSDGSEFHYKGWLNVFIK